MDAVEYSIIMHAPLGNKGGTLSLNNKSGYVAGSLSLLGHDEYIEGFIADDGECYFDGTIKTIIKTIVFHASGRISGDELVLEINNEGNYYKITGVKKNEKII